MRFLFSDLVITRALEQQKVELKDIPELIEKIKDDFNDPISNKEVIQLLLSLSPELIVDFSVESVKERITTNIARYIEEQNLVGTRLQVFAYAMVNDELGFNKYTELRHKEPKLAERFESYYIDNNTLVLVFEELDE